jgi:hypothetical protein
MNLFSLALLLILPFHLSFAEDDKDWVLDLKTSTLIPKYIGKVKEIKGKAIVEDRELKIGSKIYPQDLIKTEEKSFIKLELIDDSLITIGAQSEFSVEKWAYRTKNDRDALFSLLKGKMRAEIKSKSKEKDQLKFKSPLVALGIRGTKFLLNNSTIGLKEVSQIALMEGKIHLEGNAFTENVSMKPGDYIEVVKDETQHSSAKQKVLSEEELKNYLASEQAQQTNLLPDPVLDLVEEEKTALLIKADPTDVKNELATTSETSLELVTEKTPKIESTKEKLKKLNDLYKENQKN